MVPLGSHHVPCSGTVCWRVTWHFYSTVTSFHCFDFLTGHWLTFPLLSMLTSGIIIFILVLKQPSFGTLVLLDSREDFSGTPRSFLDLGFDQCSYPLFSRDIRLRLGRGYATSPTRTTREYIRKENKIFIL